VNEGRIADVYTPNTYTLETQNMPILSTLKGWKYGFNSPFKAEVYFVNTRMFTDMKWGTQNPIIVRDPEFGMVRLRAFGAYAARVVDAAALLKELVGTDPQFRTEEVEEFLRQNIIGKLSNALANAGVPMLDLSAHQDALGQRLAGVLSEDLRPLGIEIPRFIIENVSLPPEVEAALDKRTQMGILGNLDQYTQFQAANALETAAGNPGGGAAEGIGLGMGMAMGQRMAQTMGGSAQQPQPAPQQPQPAGPPPLPQAAAWFIAVNGQQVGPLDAAGLQQHAAAGQLTRQTLVWSQGMAAWTPAEQVPPVAAVLGQTPPPLPA
jgi:membrane protease subunit (stomatin/prohibitin family)